jgi:hypothetical protein
VPNGDTVIEIGEVLNCCFVMMPFQDLYRAQYEKVIRPAIESAGLECRRGDEIYSQQNVVDDIWASIRTCRVVLAELSGRNPNVMYEIGLAHAIGKPILLITRDERDVPFDLRNLRYIYYDTNDPNWGENLRKSITSLLEKILNVTAKHAHLDGITVRSILPSAPTEPRGRSPQKPGIRDISGTWNTRWLSISAKREHSATIVIPHGHDREFTASMVVTFERKGSLTIVQETLTGSIDHELVALTGVNYTYVQQGSSMSYSLDSFELRCTNDRELVGEAVLKNGRCPVTLIKQAAPEAGK